MFSAAGFVVLLTILFEAYCYENEWNILQINASVNGIKNEASAHETYLVTVSNVNLRREISRNKKNTTQDREVC